MVAIIGSVRLLPSRPVQPAFRHLPFVLFLLGILAYGAALVWYMLLRFDLGSLLRLNGDDAFYYFQIARNRPRASSRPSTAASPARTAITRSGCCS